MAAAALVAALLSLTPLSAPLSRDALDAQLRLLAPRQPSIDAMVFDIDDASLAALKPDFGPWPFKRDVYALVVEQLREMGARAIAIDLLLADTAEGDAALARAQARPGAPVILAAAGMRHASDFAVPRAAAPSVPPMGAAPAYAWPAIALPAASVWPPGRPPLLGVITTPLDEDGVLRALPLWHRDATQRLPLMAWAVHAAVDGPDIAEPPLDARGAYHLAMPARDAWPMVRPFSELAKAALGQRDPAALRETVRGRVIFIGSSALLADAVMTPQGQVSGTRALAQAYAALRQGSWVQPPAPLLDAALLLLALLPVLAPLLRGRPAPQRDAALSAAALLAIAGLASWALLQWRQPGELVVPLATLTSAWLTGLFLHDRGQAAARQRLAHQLAVSEEAARAKSAFLANVSHEIRTPLNALLGVAELLSKSELTPKQRLHVQVFRESGAALHSLINDLLDLSRIESGHLELHPAPYDLRYSLNQLIALMRPRAEDKGLNLVLEMAETLPTGVLGDRLRLEQALINLVGNAVKFTARGEVRLLAMPDPQVPGMLRFEVIDTGIGIAPSKLESIFEPFAQADGSVTRLYGGTGLGLSITRSILHLMGGSVQVQSAPGEGSRFTLRLPLQAVELPAAPAAASLEGAPDPTAAHGLPGASADAALAAPAHGAPLSVLLAEDNQINVYLFRSMLEGQPVALEFASDGPAALEALRRRRYDLAFVDVQMPGLDGLEVTRELRALESSSGRPRTPVVALTANAFASDVRASIDAGCDRHLAKPYSRDQLIEAIQQLAAPMATAPPPAAAGIDAETVLDRAGAVQRLGGDMGLYRRLAEHAAVFLSDWAPSFERARADGSRERAFRLAHDLKSIASTVGALAIAEHAAALEHSLRGPDGAVDVLDEPALARALVALPPVIAALTTPQEPR